MKPIQGGLKHTDVHAKYGKIAIEKLSTDFRSRSLAEQSWWLSTGMANF